MSSGFVKKWCSEISFIAFISIVARLLPHPADFVPLWAITSWVAVRWPWYSAMVLILGTLWVSDIFLAYLHGYPWWGSWSYFNYASLIFSVIAIAYYGQHNLYGVFAITLGYWVWSNFGVWAIENNYEHSLCGLAQCYIVAIPFLVNSVVGSGVWYWVLQLMNVLKFRTGGNFPMQTNLAQKI